MVSKSKNNTKFFKVDAELLRLSELGFFEKVMEGAEELLLKQAFEMGLITSKQHFDRIR